MARTMASVPYLKRGTRVQATELVGYESLGIGPGSKGTVLADVRSGNFGRVVDVLWDAGPQLLVLGRDGDHLRILPG